MNLRPNNEQKIIEILGQGSHYFIGTTNYGINIDKGQGTISEKNS